MPKLPVKEFMEYGLSVKETLKEKGFSVIKYRETEYNGIFTLSNGQEISTNGYVYN